MTPAARARDAARIAVAVLTGLLCLEFVCWHAARFSGPTAALAAALGVLPWLLVVGGLWRGDRRRYVAATLLVAPYIAYGSMELIANRGARAWATALAVLAVALFLALTAFLRLSRPRAAAPT